MYKGQPTGWFTTENGTHVPLYGNETKAQALDRQFGTSYSMDRRTAEFLKDKTIKETMPDGWKITEGATTAPRGYTWINNGESLFNGKRQSALIRTNNIRKDV